MAQLWILDLGHIVISQHQLRDEYLLINTADHDFFIDRLIVASDEIAVKIHIQVVHGFYQQELLSMDDVTAMIAGQIGKFLPMDEETAEQFRQLAKRMMEQVGK